MTEPTKRRYIAVIVDSSEDEFKELLSYLASLPSLVHVKAGPARAEQGR